MNKDNANNLQEDRPFGEVALSLGWTQTKNNRKQLQTIRKTNRENVQNETINHNQTVSAQSESKTDV